MRPSAAAGHFTVSVVLPGKIRVGTYHPEHWLFGRHVHNRDRADSAIRSGRQRAAS